VGEGLFLTNLHVVKWIRYPLLYDHTTHVAQIWLFSGTGNLDECEAREPSIISKGSLEVKVVGWPGPAIVPGIVGTLSQNYAVQGGLVAGRYEVDIRQDFCLLEAVETRWKGALRSGSRPHVLPGRLDQLHTTFAATFVGVNGPSEDMTKYDPDVNSVDQLIRAFDSLLPGVITYASTSQAVQCLCDRAPAPVGTPAELLRYPISSSGGSSGSGIYEDATKRLVGIHTRAEIDPVCVLPGVRTSMTSPNNRTVAIALTSPEFGDFARNIIIPQLIRIGTFRAKRIAAEWALIAN
jgi:hypothetical protein